MARKRRYKTYLQNENEKRSRSARYRNPPSNSSSTGANSSNVDLHERHESHSSPSLTFVDRGGPPSLLSNIGGCNAFPFQEYGPCGKDSTHSSNYVHENSHHVPHHCGIQQGSPCSPSLFVGGVPSQGDTSHDQISDASSFTSSTSGQSDLHFGGAEDELFNGHWDRDAHEQIMSDSDSDHESYANDELRAEVANDDQRAEVANDDALGGFQRLRAFLAKDENNEAVNATVDVTNCEILLAVLKYALTYSLSQTAVADLFKLICVILGRDDLPISRYLLDKLFNNKEGVEYHACCPECKKYVSRFDQSTKTLTCRRCNHLIDVKSPTYNEFFAIIDPRFEIANLLEMNWDEYQKILRKETPPGIYSDFTDGELYRAFVNSLPLHVRFRFISLLFNADGAALYKSSNFSIWPIQAIVNELPYSVRTAAPVTCGIWFGRDKPDMQIFLKEFVLSMNKLSVEGVPCKIGDEIHNIKVYCPCACVDSMARGPMQGFKLCTGYFGCNWCLHPGMYVASGDSGAVKYVVLQDIPDRTEAETKEHMRKVATSSKKDVYGVKFASWLIHLFSFNIILGFVPDPMHHVDLGLGKQFLERWLTILTPRERDRIDSLMKKIKVPNNVQRLSRPIKDRKFWKAQEWENFILYYSLPILRAFPKMSQIADHWALLVEGYYKLMKATVTRNDIFSAHELFKEFVVKTEAIYTKEFMTFNLHQLLHLAQSVLNWGPLWSHSGYAFESNNANYLKQIHSPKGVTLQICRSVSMRQSEVILRRHVASMDDSSITDYVNYLEYSGAKKTSKLTNERYLGAYRKPSRAYRARFELSQNARIYHKMVKKGCLYRGMRNRCVRSDDSYARLDDGRYVHICEFIADESLDRSVAVCKLLQVQSAMDRDMPIVVVVDEGHEKVYIDTNKITTVCVAVKIDDIMYLTPPPNLYRI